VIRSFIIATISIFSFFPSASDAGVITFSRGQTLAGWNERTFTTTWVDLAPDVKNLVSTDANGDLRGFNHATSTVWLASPTFVLEAGPITISQLYLMSGGGTAPTTVNDIAAAKSNNGWAGIALRDQSGNFVLTYDTPTAWGFVELSATNLQPFVGQALTLDLISVNNSSNEFFYVNRPITVSGTLAPASVPEPASCVLLGLGSVVTMLIRRRTKNA
jgi:hypothetical protein